MHSGRSCRPAGSPTATSACCSHHPAGKLKAGTVLVVALTALPHPAVPQPAGSLLYELVFVVDLTGELRAWPQDSWQQVGVDPDQVAQAVVGCWQDGEVTGLQVDDLSFEEARSLTRPAMTYARGRLTARLVPRPPALAASHQRPPTR